MSLERRQILLGAATVLVLGFAAWTFWPSAPQAQAVTQPARARAGRPNATPVENGPVADVKLGSLTASRGEPGEAQRNPFRFQPKAQPPPKLAPPPVMPPPVVTETQTKPVERGLPAIPLKFIGLVERANGVKWAVLTDGKSAPMHGKDGDIIDGKYLIVKIGAESIEMTYTDGRGKQVIRLTGQ